MNFEYYYFINDASIKKNHLGFKIFKLSQIIIKSKNNSLN